MLRPGADLLAIANPGCTLQIQKLLGAGARRFRAAHPIEILDASIRGVGLPGGEPDHGEVPASSAPAPATRTG